MNKLQTFNYKDTSLQAVEIDGELWWVLKDVCAILGISKHRDVAMRLDEDERGSARLDTLGGRQNVTIINEPGLYNVILRSDKPEAKDFKRWVTHEVLPSIRHAGSYAIQPKTPAELIAAQAQLMVDMERKVEEVASHTLALEAKVDNAVKVFSRPAQDHWKNDMDAAIKELCQAKSLSIPATQGRMYDELEHTAGCSVNSRLTRLRQRKKKSGTRHRDAMALTKLDAIAADKQLRSIFESVVRRWQAESCNK